jgi:hypothetical protein
MINYLYFFYSTLLLLSIITILGILVLQNKESFGFDYNINTYQSPTFKTITQNYELSGKWIAEWYSNPNILIDEIVITQNDNKIIAKYAKQPIYQNCDGNIILPNSKYLSGKITSNDKIIGNSWACNDEKKIEIPIELKISKEGTKLSGSWLDIYGVENRLIFTKISSEPFYGKDQYGQYGKDQYGQYGKDQYGQYGKDQYGVLQPENSQNTPLPYSIDECMASGNSRAACEAALVKPDFGICEGLALANVPCPIQ